MTYVASIVIPLLRQVDSWLEQSVLSAVNQSVPTEVIVVRSALTPRSNLDLLQRLEKHHPNLASILEEKPHNFPAAINQGIRATRTDRVGFLLSDDWLEKTAVAESVSETTDIVSSRTLVHFANGDVNELASGKPSMQTFLSFKTVEEKANYLEHFFLFRKECLLRVGGLDENIGNYPGIDDYDLIWTLLENEASVAIIERPLYHYRDHDSERLTLQDPELVVANLRKILRKHHVADDVEDEVIARHAPWYGKSIYQVMSQIHDPQQRAETNRKQVDVGLEDILELARIFRLDRFVTDGVFPTEYECKSSGGTRSYADTGRLVACRIDGKGRSRIQAPFHLWGHVVCTKPEQMHGIFWCIDLLKSGYSFAYLLPSVGPPRRVSLWGHFAKILIGRMGQRWTRASDFRRRRLIWSTYHQMARSRAPSYQPEPRRVLMITSTYNRGGSERQMVATAAALLKRGWDVRIMAFGSLQAGDASFEEEILRLGITPHLSSEFEIAEANRFSSLVPALGTQAFTLPRLFKSRIASAHAAIRHFRPAVVHGWLDVPAVVGSLAACELGVPRVVIGQRNCCEIMTIQHYSSEILEALWHGYRSLSTNPAVAILNNSAAGAAGYERWLGLRPGTIRVLYNGYIPEWVRKPAADEVRRFRAGLGWSDAPVVGCVMRFEEYKDPLLWLDTAAEMAKLRPDVRFLLAGYGTMRDAIVGRIETLGLGDRIVLPGPVTDVGLMYAAADVILLTSLCEGVPNILMEAQAAGRPVVVTDFSTASEAIVHGRTGSLVPGRSAKRLAQATIAVLDDPSWAARARIEGPAFVASRFDPERMVRETIDLYTASETSGCLAIPQQSIAMMNGRGMLAR